MAFDPLCGEGAGHAAREALLTSAIVRAASKGLEVEALLSHYTTRLMQGFLRHLQVCRSFYQSGGESSFWKMEASALQRGILCIQERLRNLPATQYRLTEFDLEPIQDSPMSGKSTLSGK
jgi:hypothetical protein